MGLKEIKLNVTGCQNTELKSLPSVYTISEK